MGLTISIASDSWNRLVFSVTCGHHSLVGSPFHVLRAIDTSAGSADSAIHFCQSFIDFILSPRGLRRRCIPNRLMSTDSIEVLVRIGHIRRITPRRRDLRLRHHMLVIVRPEEVISPVSRNFLVMAVSPVGFIVVRIERVARVKSLRRIRRCRDRSRTILGGSGTSAPWTLIRCRGRSLVCTLPRHHPPKRIGKLPQARGHQHCNEVTRHREHLLQATRMSKAPRLTLSTQDACTFQSGDLRAAERIRTPDLEESSGTPTDSASQVSCTALNDCRTRLGIQVQPVHLVSARKYRFSADSQFLLRPPYSTT